MDNAIPPSCANKTGSWRSRKPVVDESKCVGCKTCERGCPDSCIRVVDGKAKVDYDYCKGCGICAHECPVKCIKME
ncbi:MAG: 4Fe-4S binding protein [Candidatus Micrarchaeia archaeon]